MSATALPPQAAYAEEIGLRYITGERQGISREKKGRIFQYFAPDGSKIENERILGRITSLKIPPAWSSVWISSDPRSHLQATGVDLKGRKQYLYHPEWSKMRCETKFDRMAEFGEVLPEIRKQINEQLKYQGLTREKMLATVIGLLDHTLIRIGNRSYQKENNSYGLTTLRNKHMRTIGNKVVFEFTGKKGVEQMVHVTDSRLSKIVKKCREIPGHQLFQYLDENGERQPITSDDVNNYLKTITNKEISSKDFRTWGGSVHAVKLLLELDYPETEQEIKKNITEVVKEVARKLGNTATVCRKHYLHPIVIKAYSDNQISKLIKKYPDYHLKGSRQLYPEEKLFMKILHKLSKEL
jgi:DNA topoisomerase I